MRTPPPCRLRALVTGDACFVRRLMNEPGWLRHIGDRGVRDEADAVRYVAEGPWSRCAEQGYGMRVIEALAPQQPIGLCGILCREGFAEPDLGFALLDAAAGRGYAYAAARQMLDIGRRELNLRRLTALTSAGNERSIALLLRLGFRYERELVLGPTSLQLYARALT